MEMLLPNSSRFVLECAVKDAKLIVFAYLGANWHHVGNLILMEESAALWASIFDGLNILNRVDALELDEVSKNPFCCFSHKKDFFIFTKLNY